MLINSQRRAEQVIETALALSVADAAKMLGLGKSSMYELVRQKKIPHVRVGRRVLIPRRALESWLVREQVSCGGEVGDGGNIAVQTAGGLGPAGR